MKLLLNSAEPDLRSPSNPKPGFNFEQIPYFILEESQNKKKLISFSFHQFLILSEKTQPQIYFNQVNQLDIMLIFPHW